MSEHKKPLHAQSVPKRFSLANSASVIGAIVLVGSEVIAAGIAAGWAFAGIFRLGDAGFYVLGSLFGLISLMATLAFARQALRAEPLFTGKN